MNEQLINLLGKDEACKAALLAMRNMSKDEMLDLYIKNIDFSITSDLMDADFFLKESYLGDRIYKGIYVNENAKLKNPNMVVGVGSCNIHIEYSGYNVSQIFVRDNTCINVIAKDNTYTIIDCFGSSFVNIDQSGEAIVLLNLYGNSNCEYTGNVKMTRKLSDKYQ